MDSRTRRDKFYAIVFEPALELKSYHRRICYELVRHRQDPFLLFVDFVGTALLQHTSYLVDPYISYAGRHVQAKYIFDVEKYRNTAFRRWVDTQDEDDRVRKLDIKHFLSRPTFRIAKYKLQLEAIAKYSDHMADQVALNAAIDTLQDLLYQMNEAIRIAETSTHLLRITSSLVPASTAASLGLLPSSNGDGIIEHGGDHGAVCLLHEGRFRLTRLSSHSLRAQVCHVFLFSHALLLTKPRGQPGHEKYVLIGRPIPLPMLSASTQRSSIMRRISGRIISHQQRYHHYHMANNLNSGRNSAWTTDLRHRFSLTSTTSTSSSWSTDSSSSSSLSPTSSLSTSPSTSAHVNAGTNLSELPKHTTIDWMHQPVSELPTVTGLHLRARLIQRWQHMKRSHQTYPEPTTRSTPTNIEKGNHIPPISPTLHRHHHHIDKKVLVSPMITTPPSSPLGFVKRRNSIFRYSSSFLGRRSSLFSLSSSSTTSTHATTPTTSPIRLLSPLFPSPPQQNQQSSEEKDQQPQQSTGYHGQSRLTIRHLAYPETTFDLQCRHLQHRDQWYGWIQKALEESAFKTSSPSFTSMPASPTSPTSPIISNNTNHTNHLTDNIKPPFRLGLICQVPVGSSNPININGDRKLPAGCGRIFCSLPFVTLDGNQVIALGTQHGLWVAARESTGEEFQLIEMMECHQMDTLNGHLVVRSHRTLKSYSLTQLAALMKKRSPPPTQQQQQNQSNDLPESSPMSPTCTIRTTTTNASTSSTYAFQTSPDQNELTATATATVATSTSASYLGDASHTCYPLSISSVTIKRSSVLSFVVGTLYGCPVLCYLGRTRKHRKHHHQQNQHQQGRRTSYLRRNLKWSKVIVIYTIKPSKRSSDVLSLKKEKVIPLLLEDGTGLDIYNNKIYVRSASQGIECINAKTEQSTLLSQTPPQDGLEDNTSRTSREEEQDNQDDQPCATMPTTTTTTPISNISTHPWLDVIHLPPNTYDDDDLALLCTNEAAWMINKRTMVFEEWHPVIRFEANVKSVALIYPYLILFSNCIIEIRHLELNNMVQVIPGHNIRCVYLSSPSDTQRPVIQFTMLHHPDERVNNVYQLVL
ncbi:unnamed protein product [Absidia cylindrospora]